MEPSIHQWILKGWVPWFRPMMGRTNLDQKNNHQGNIIPINLCHHHLGNILISFIHHMDTCNLCHLISSIHHIIQQFSNASTSSPNSNSALSAFWATKAFPSRECTFNKHTTSVYIRFCTSSSRAIWVISSVNVSLVLFLLM